MTWLKNIQNKSHAQKIRMIRAVAIVIIILLVALWVVSSRYKKHAAADTTLFKKIEQTAKDFKDNYHK